MSLAGRRAGHLLVAVVGTAALVLQTVLVVQGSVVLDEQDPPALGLRLARLVAYFTIQSNLLVTVAAWALVGDPDRDGRLFRAVRLAGVMGITVTGLVHFVLLRPLLDLHGADLVADRLLHMAVPTLAVLAWLLLGPRPRVDAGAVRAALAWPVAWLVVTLLVGRTTGWVPYPFLDADENGWGAVMVAVVGVTALVGALLAGFAALDRRLPAAPRDP